MVMIRIIHTATTMVSTNITIIGEFDTLTKGTTLMTDTVVTGININFELKQKRMQSLKRKL
jgi:hypothetical protein